MERFIWQEVPVYDVLGNRTSLSLKEAWITIFNVKFGVFLVFIVVIMVLTNIHGYQSVMPVWRTCILWSVCAVTLIGFYQFFHFLGATLRSYQPDFRVYFPLVGVVSMTLNTILTRFHAELLATETLELPHLAGSLALNIALGFTFESLFCILIHPQIRAHLLATGKLAKPDNRNIRIGSDRFEVSEIVSLHSQDHYVEVITDNTTTLVRARLADFLKELNDSDGILTHRSHWVAKRAIQSIDLINGDGITTYSMKKIPIACTRRQMVGEWAALQGLTVNQISGAA
ncbi:MAG: LytTR family transcriptional regulator [Rhodobacteraceae bacterium]|nr:LytTR family transcriptional regulator [Paracoccaceae bacterium]